MEFYIRDVAMRELSDFEFYTRQFIQEFHIEIHELLSKKPQKEICKNSKKIIKTVCMQMQTQSERILQHNCSPSIQ